MTSANSESFQCPQPAQTPLKNGSYLTYIMFAVPNRFNFTKSVLDTRLPGFFNATHRQCVLYNDSRMYKHAGLGAASLMLSYIDLWREIGSKSDTELADNDWIFLFEDDVDIIPLSILKSFYPKLYLKWSKTGQSKSLGGNRKCHIFRRYLSGSIYDSFVSLINRCNSDWIKTSSKGRRPLSWYV